MKRVLALTLAVVMLLGLCACGAATDSSKETTAAEVKGLKVGFAKVKITPTVQGIPLAGYGNAEKRLSKGMLSDLYAVATAVTDEEGNTVLMMVLDLPNMYNPMPDYRTKVADTVGLPVDQVMICCTHTHSAPDMKKGEIPAQANYNTQLLGWMKEAAQTALDDRKLVTGMYTATAETESLNFVRRYILENGTYAGDNYGDFNSSPIKCHETEPDRTLQMLKFTREGGKDVILSNFQTHPHLTGAADKYDVSADTVGVYRDELERQLNCEAMYFSGSSGNINPKSRITEENVYKDFREHGKAMANYAVQAAANFVEVPMGKVQFQKTTYVGTCNHLEDDKYELAREIQRRQDSGMTNKEAMEGFKTQGINSVYHAASIISKKDLPETMGVELFGVSVGDFALVFAPFELYSELGVDIKTGSQFQTTFVCCYANELYSYMPTQAAFEIGGYGPNQCKFMPGTGEELVSEYLTILGNLYASK